MARSARPANRRRKRRGWRRLIPTWRFFVGAFLLLAAVGAGAFGYLYATTDVPEPDDFALAETTTVYYADGETQIGSFAEVRRTSVALDTLPDYVPHAVVASEDQSFYENAGIDLKGIARAFINNVRGGARQGGSTLTQQYAERYYLGETTGYAGKVREAVLALKIDKQQSKDQVLENYLNTIYFGRGAYGIEEAAKTFFGVPAAELNLSQTALLVAIIPAPSAWDPAVNLEKAQTRYERVLNRMVEDGWITADEAKATSFPDVLPVDNRNAYEGPNGYLLQAVRSELVASETFTEAELDTRGLKITTTIDEEMQGYALEAIDTLPEDRPANNYVGLVSVDPANGEIKALYGGADFLERQRNAVTQDRAQGGSTFKPFALVAALENGIPLQKTYSSASPMEIGGTTFENYQLRGLGTINLLTATANSVNTVFVQLNEEVGPAATKDVAIRAGIPEDTPGLTEDLANVLGPASPRPIDVARAYSTFAAQGVRTTPHIVATVSDAEGNVIYRGDTTGERVFDEDVMAGTTYALQQVTGPNGTARKVGQIGRPVAGKTGTSSHMMSAWFAGFVPQLVTVVDMYQVGPNGEEQSLEPFGQYRYVEGGSYPADLWLEFMSRATLDMEVKDFPPPSKKAYTPPPPPSPSPTEEQSE
ncbi:MAG: transglycosylase domain-containing protein, partial [Flaviflexus sp.]|nr:transglycosylase domain-containing protein [Flaviflexus sp.]